MSLSSTSDSIPPTAHHAIFNDVGNPWFFLKHLRFKLIAYWNRVPDFTKQVTIIINEDDLDLTASFTVSRCLPIETSKYFREACGVAWQSCTVRLRDVDNDAFNSYICWVTRKVLAIYYDWEVDTEPQEALSTFVKLWLLADRLDDSKLRNEVMNAVIEVTNTFRGRAYYDELFPPHMTGLIWSTALKGKALRRYVVDHYIQDVKSEDVEPRWGEFHPDFIKDLAARSLESGNAGGRVDNGLPAPPECTYHDHRSVHEVCAQADEPEPELFVYDF